MPTRPVKHAVVTGCNRGLGLAVAKRLAQEGFRIAAVCRRPEDAQKTVAVLGRLHIPVQLDFAAGDAAVRSAAAEISTWLGSSKLLILVNNSGNSYGSWDEAAWHESRAVNYKGAICLTEELLPNLATGASVTMVGSGLGDLQWLSPKFQRLLAKARCVADLDRLAHRSIDSLDTNHSWVGPYGFSKALLHRATEIFAADHRFESKSILVKAVCPGWVSTDMGGAQAPISVEEGAEHILTAALSSDATEKNGSFRCYCYKNWDEQHTRAWEEKHGKACDYEESTDKGCCHAKDVRKSSLTRQEDRMSSTRTKKKRRSESHF